MDDGEIYNWGYQDGLNNEPQDIEFVDHLEYQEGHKEGLEKFLEKKE